MEDSKRAPRRPHSADLKALVLAECAHPGASVAGVAQKHGLNANLVHKWRRGAGAPSTRPSSVHTPADDRVGAFVALEVAPQVAAAAPSDIRIEVRRGGTAMNIHWPTQAAGECATWLCELLR